MAVVVVALAVVLIYYTSRPPPAARTAESDLTGSDGRFVVITGPEGQSWASAAAKAA